MRSKGETGAWSVGIPFRSVKNMAFLIWIRALMLLALPFVSSVFFSNAITTGSIYKKSRRPVLLCNILLLAHVHLRLLLRLVIFRFLGQ